MDYDHMNRQGEIVEELDLNVSRGLYFNEGPVFFLVI